MSLSYRKYSLAKGVQKVKTKTGLLLSTLVLAVGGGGGLSFALLGSAHAAVSSSYNLFGDASIVSGGNPGNAVQATTSGSHTYGGVTLNEPTNLTVSQLQNLSTDYNFTNGTCGAGSPRFSVAVSNGTTSGNLFFYLGAAPNYNNCPPNVWTPSGNLAAPTNLVDASQIGGTFYETYAQVQAAYGSYNVTGIDLVADGSNQTVLFDNTMVNDTTYTYEPAPTKDSCKNDGWKTLVVDGNSFRNQGLCVSYFASNGKSQH